MKDQLQNPEVAKRHTYRGQIERILDRAPDVRSIFVNTREQRLSAFAPGMFISITIPLDDELRVRPYTIASNYAVGEPLELVLDRVPNGRGAAWLFERNVGDEFDFTGPFGLFTLTEAPASELVFVAEGTAIAPIRPMLHQSLRQPVEHPVRLLYGARSTEHLLYRAEFEAWRDNVANFEYDSFIVADRAELYRRMSGEVRKRWVESSHDRSRSFYICGVGPGVVELRDLLRNAGYDRRAVHYEKW